MSAWRVVRRLVALSAPPWGRLALAVLAGVAAALATIGLLAGSGYVVTKAAFHPGLSAIAGLLAGVEVLAFLRGPLRYEERLVGHDAAFLALGHWRVWLYDQLEPRSPAGLGRRRSGDLLASAVDDVDALQDLYLRGVLPLAVAVVASVLAVVLVAMILPVAGLILSVSLLASLIFPPLLAARTARGSARETVLRGTLGAEVIDLLGGAADLVANGRDEDVLSRLDELDAELSRSARRRALGAGATTALLTMLLGVSVVGVTVAGIDAVRAHHLSAVMLAVLPLATIGAFESVPAVSAAAGRLAGVVAAGRRLLDLSDLPVPVVDPAEPVALPEGPTEVAFKDARLRYAEDLPWALDGLTMELPVASHTAMVGASGAGKSSLINVLLGFWPLSEGEATLNGVPLGRLDQDELRRTVALVDQDARLFAGTIAHNITLGRPAASEQEIDEAVSLAQLDEWIRTLPDGLLTEVGEYGAKVSGGQRQRIALARALLAGGSVLVLDEPTANLDEATAERLLADVLAASGSRTVLLVTHRTEEAALFSRTITVERGRVV